jgi:hypothetical protein
MKKFIWFLAGIGIGVAAVKQINTNPKAQVLATDVAKRAKEFGAAVSDGFREREAEIAKAKKPSTKSAK